MHQGLVRYVSIIAVSIALIAATIMLSMYKISDSDLFWHLKTGQTILEKHRLLSANTFSSLHADHPWDNPEWLFQVIMAWVFRWGGWDGITLLKMLMTSALALCTFGLLKQVSGSTASAASLTVLGLTLIMYRFLERPHLFSFLFFALVMLAVARLRLGRRGVEIIVIPLFALWSNIHPEAIIGMAFLALTALGETINRRLGTPAYPGGLGRLWRLTALAAAATLANPDGWRVLVFPFLHLNIGPTILVSEYMFSWPKRLPQFWIFAGTVAAITAILSRRRRWDEMLPLAVLFFFGAAYIRATPYFVLAALPIACSRLRTMSSPWSKAARSLLAIVPLILAMVTFWWTTGKGMIRPYTRGLGLDTMPFPVAAADFLASHPFPGNLYNTYGIGGYLIYRLYPKLPVFQDGRLQAYPPEFIAQFNSDYSRSALPQLLDQYGVNSALVHHMATGATFSPEKWALVYWDHSWFIYVRRTESAIDLINRFEYRVFRPESDIFKINDPAQLVLAVSEMERNQQHRLTPTAGIDVEIGIALGKLKRLPEAEKAFQRAIDKDPNNAAAWSNLGLTYQYLGRIPEAINTMTKALALDPSQELIRRRLEALRLSTGNP